jgi:hypothetical protein
MQDIMRCLLVIYLTCFLVENAQMIVLLYNVSYRI